MNFEFRAAPLDEAVHEICERFNVTRADTVAMPGTVTGRIHASSPDEALRAVLCSTCWGFHLSPRPADDGLVVLFIDRRGLDAKHSYLHSGGTAESFFRHIAGFSDLVAEVRAKRFPNLEPFEMKDKSLREILDFVSAKSGVRWSEDHGVITIEEAEPGATDNPGYAQ